MKATCISACEIPGVGIVGAGDAIELPDGFYNDPRIRQHFSIQESTVADKHATPPDLLAAADARRERFAQSLCDHTARIRALNRLIDFGVELPRELADNRDDVLSEAEKIAKIVELWCDNFGYEFPTDPVKKPKMEKPPKGKGKKDRPPKRPANAGEEKGQPDVGDDAGEGGEAQPDNGADQPDGGEAQPDGGEAQPDNGEKDPGVTQLELLDRLNGKS